MIWYFLLDVIEHVQNPVEFVEVASFYLKRDGYPIINVPAVQTLYSNYDVVAGHLRRYDKRRLNRDIKDAGMRATVLTYWGMSLVPLLALRKLLLAFSKREDVIRTGFSPPGRWADKLLRLMMHTELAVAARVPYGTSLLAIAQRGS